MYSGWTEVPVIKPAQYLVSSDVKRIVLDVLSPETLASRDIESWLEDGK